jgi:protein-S-isoprenylcysteine O-methyltransferase Ste14
MFLFLNGSLAYIAKVRQLRSEGKEPPKYFQSIFFPQGRPKFKEAAPRSTHFLVGVAAAITGAFFVFCGIALAFEAQWSRISEPFIVAAICVALAGIGVAFLYLAWRLLAFGTKAPANVA